MAVLQFSGLVSQVQGKLNGSVLSRGRSGNVLYNKPTQRKEPTAAKLEIRGGFSGASFYWNALSTGEQADWNTLSAAHPVPNRFGDMVVLSGFNYFKKMMALAWPEGAPAPIVANLADEPAYEFTLDLASTDWQLLDTGFELVDFTVGLTITSDSPAINQVNIYISLPVRNQNNPYFKTWYLVGSEAVAADLGVSEEIEINFPSVLLPSGWRTADGNLHLVKVVMFITDQGSVSVSQFLPIDPVLLPPPPFPDFEFAMGASISFGGSGSGIFEYYWLTAQKSEILAGYTADTQFAPPQNSMSEPSPGDWSSSFLSVFLSAGSGTVLIPDEPVGETDWYDVWYDAVASAWTPAFGWYAPVRMRLIRNDTAAAGEWVTGYWPIFLE